MDDYIAAMMKAIVVEQAGSREVLQISQDRSGVSTSRNY